jgi:hypothetical protein
MKHIKIEVFVCRSICCHSTTHRHCCETSLVKRGEKGEDCSGIVWYNVCVYVPDGSHAILSIYLILPAVLGPGDYSASKRAAGA